MLDFLLAQSRAAAVSEMRSVVIIKKRGAATQDATTGEWSSGTAPADVKVVGSLTPRVGKGKETTQSGLQEARKYAYLSVPYDTVITPNMTLTVDGIAYQIDEVTNPNDPQAITRIVSVYR